jgi:hypothetical protein
MLATNKQYHKSFVETSNSSFDQLNEIPTKVISEIRATIQAGLFRTKDEKEKLQMLFALKNQLVQLYNIDQCEIQIVPHWPSVGSYSTDHKTIIIDKCSLVTFLHEFRHHIQHCLNLNIIDVEDDARGWSHSAYFLATPRLFETAVRKGILIFQNTFTTPSLLTNEQIADIQNVHFIRRSK